MGNEIETVSSDLKKEESLSANYLDRSLYREHDKQKLELAGSERDLEDYLMKQKKSPSIDPEPTPKMPKVKEVPNVSFFAVATYFVTSLIPDGVKDFVRR